MLAKIFKGGLTYRGAVTVILYLLNERVRSGLAKVFKGDSKLTLMLISQASKKFKWSWISGVLSFSETLSRDVINSIIKDFEHTFFCGMDPGQYNILWVLHTDKGRTELHFIAPRMELSNRKHFNPYYLKRDFGKKDIFQEYINQKWGLSSYLDNQRPVYGSRPKWSGDKPTHEEELNDLILDKVNARDLGSRNDIIDLLREWDYEIVEIGINHIAIISDEGEELTLKGHIYGKKFYAGIDLLEENMKRYCPPKIGIQNGIIVRESTRNFTKLERALDEIIEKQSFGNRKRYPSPTRKPRLTRKRSKTIKKEKENSNDSNRERIIGLIHEERARARKRKKRIAEIAEWNLWTESANHKYITENLEQWIRERRLREYLEQGLRAIFGKFGRVEQKLARRNEEALEVLSHRQQKRSLNNSNKIRI
jgi:hypothetical protein